MAEKIKLVRGDTGPALKVIVTDQNLLPVNLSGGSARLRFRASGTTTLLATLNGTLLPGLVNADGTVNTAPPYDISGAGGQVAFSWGSVDLMAPAGSYEGEIETTTSSGLTQTVYDLLKFTLREQF